MGISFKLSKVGVRVHPAARSASAALAQAAEAEKSGAGEKEGSLSESRREDNFVERGKDINGIKILPACSKEILTDHEVSFTFSLYERGYLISKSASMDPSQTSIQDGKTLHPYDRASEKLFSEFHRRNREKFLCLELQRGPCTFQPDAKTWVFV